MTSTSAGARASGFDPRWLPLAVTTVGIVHVDPRHEHRQHRPAEHPQGLHASLQNGQLVIAVYLIALAVVIPLTGFLGERVGMKRLYMFTLACFTVGSALCGLAWNVESLIVFRVSRASAAACCSRWAWRSSSR